MDMFKKRVRKRNRIFKYSIMIILQFICIPIVYASEYNIVITADGSKSHEDFNITETTIDIPISISGYEDIYAFSIAMDYLPYKVKIESISLGDIFKDYGNAVLINKIDNDNGNLEFMQTLLGVEKGVDTDGVLCTIRITFSSGEYDIVNDLGLVVKIADSTPEYMDVTIPEFKFIVGAASQNADATSTLAPAITATVGVVTPDPNSEKSQDFIAVEEKDVDEIYKEIDEIKEEQSNTVTAETSASGMSQISNSADGINNYEKTGIEEGNKNNLLSIILIVILFILIAFFLVAVIIRVKASKVINDSGNDDRRYGQEQ